MEETSATVEQTQSIILSNDSIAPPMKIFALLNSYVGVSGGDMRLIEIMKSLKNEKNAKLTIVTCKEGQDACLARGLEATFMLTDNNRKTKNVIFTYLKRILRAVSIRPSAEKNDILYSSSDFLPDTLPAFIWKLRNKKAKWILCIHLIIPSLFEDYKTYFSCKKKFSMPTFSRILYYLSQQITITLGKHYADKVLVVNKLDKNYLSEKRGVNSLKIRVVDNGVNCNCWKTLEPNAPLFDAIFVGRFHPQKGILDLPAIWKLVCEKRPNAKLCIVGTGPTALVDKVTREAKKNRLSQNIFFAGYRDDAEKFSMLKSSRIFLCPSHYESFGIVIAEAMSCGLPVIAYDLPVYRDIYGKHMLQVPLGAQKQFADAILNFLNDDALRRTYGFQGMYYIQKYDWRKIASKEYEFLTELMEKT